MIIHSFRSFQLEKCKWIENVKSMFDFNGKKCVKRQNKIKSSFALVVYSNGKTIHEMYFLWNKHRNKS